MQPSEFIHDEVLMQHLQEGDSNSLAELYNRHVKALYNYAYRLSGNKDVAQDAVQDTFVEIWNRRQTLGQIRNAKAYLLSCTRRRISLLANESASYQTGTNLEAVLLDTSIEDFIITEENFEQRVAYLKSSLQHLPKREYECLHLRFFEELSYEEVADVMHITAQSARNTIGKALSKLRVQLPKSLLISLAALALLHAL